MPAAEDRSLLALALLLDVTPGCDTARFVQVALPRLLNHLSRRTERRRVEQHAQIRGSVDWPATYRARHGGDYDPLRYVCRQVHHQFDTLENQLMRHTLDEIGRLLAAVPPALRTGAIVVHRPDALHAEPTFRRLALLESAIRRARRNIYLRQVATIAEVSTAHRHRAQVMEMEEYRAALTLADHLDARQTQPTGAESTAYARTVFSRMLPLPDPTADGRWGARVMEILQGQD